MPKVNWTLQRASNSARQRASPTVRVTESTGLLRWHKVSSVGWLGLGLVNEATRQALLITSFTGTVLVQVTNSKVCRRSNSTQLNFIVTRLQLNSWTAGARFSKNLRTNLGKLRIRSDLGKSLKNLGWTYTKLTINVIIKMQFLQNNVTFFHKIVCIYI